VLKVQFSASLPVGHAGSWIVLPLIVQFRVAHCHLCSVAGFGEVATSGSPGTQGEVRTVVRPQHVSVVLILSACASSSRLEKYIYSKLALVI